MISLCINVYVSTFMCISYVVSLILCFSIGWALSRFIVFILTCFIILDASLFLNESKKNVDFSEGRAEKDWEELSGEP